ncbi:MAG: hypothetical protein GX561_01235 [Lentisphaerae bacterium]|jgi:Icc-related predicted phosphoesterase|nr:hypothetical protein [Lentisphaerota bacterium]
MKTAFLPMLAISATLANPILKVGLITDTHVTPKESSAKLVRMAYEFFRDQNVDAIANIGDIADRYFPEAYAHIRKAYDETFQNSEKPREMFVYANHDRIDRDNWEEAFQDVKRLLGNTNDIYDTIVLKGFPFVIMPQFADSVKYEEILKKNSEQFPGKPIFLLDHVPAFDTVYNSQVWGSRRSRTILENFPQIIQLSGHVHGSLRNELNIWQGGFTVVNCGGLAYWGGMLFGIAPKNKYSDEVIVMEVHANQVVFRRFSLSTREEINPDQPWTVTYPYDPSNPTYSPAIRKEKSQTPAFAQNAKLTLTPQGIPCSELRIQAPTATHPLGVFKYVFKVAKRDQQGNWIDFALKEEFGDFHIPPSQPRESTTMAFSSGHFAPETEYRFSVTAQDFYGNESSTLYETWKAPELASGKMTFENKNPMQELKFLSGLADGNPLPIEDGFYFHKGGNARLEIPDEAWDVPAGTKFRFTIDLQFKQNTNATWTMVLRNPTPLTNANARIHTPPGDLGIQRHVIEFTKRDKDFKYYFLLREGDPGYVKFNYVKVEILPE